MGQNSNMKDSLTYEASGFDVQDAFYKREFNTKKIIRFPWDNEYARVMQQQDIDLTLYLKDFSMINVSEKKRSKDYDDIFLELFQENMGCNIPTIKPGWVASSRAELLVIFFPSYAKCIYMKDLMCWYKTTVVPAITQEFKSNCVYACKDTMDSAWLHSCRVQLPDLDVPVLRMRSRLGNNVWWSYNIIIPSEYLESNGVTIKNIQL